MPESDSPAGSQRGRVADIRSGQNDPSLESDLFESDLTELRAKFASDEGGHLSAELSSDLALEIVLNEIVEQACLATGATGAAIILERDGEMVCRARTGENAPELGARLDNEAGLTAECIRTRKVQRCDDALDDSRVDSEACSILGVRSVLVLPLLQNDDLIGVFELFSPNASAFGERDERTLEALSLRMLKVLKQSRQPQVQLLERAENVAPVVDSLGVGGIEETRSSAPASEDLVTHPPAEETAYQTPNYDDEDTGRKDSRGIEVLTWLMAAAVLAFAAWLGIVGAERFLRRPEAAHRAVRSSGPVVAERKEENVARSSPAPTTAPNSSATSSVRPIPAQVDRPAAAANSSPAAPKSPPSDGGLRIYENGKEIFNLPPNAEQTSAGTAKNGSGEGAVDRPIVQPAAIYELSPEAAEGSLLRRVEPDYPEQARQQGIQGPVVLQVHIGADGAVQNVKLVRGQPLLAEASMTAVKQWVFKPRMVKGQRVPMQTQVTLNFRLPG